jgi:hypothetical protein
MIASSKDSISNEVQGGAAHSSRLMIFSCFWDSVGRLPWISHQTVWFQLAQTTLLADFGVQKKVRHVGNSTEALPHLQAEQWLAAGFNSSCSDRLQASLLK